MHLETGWIGYEDVHVQMGRAGTRQGPGKGPGKGPGRVQRTAMNSSTEIVHTFLLLGSVNTGVERSTAQSDMIPHALYVWRKMP